MEIYYATTNAAKATSLQRACDGYGITVKQVPLEIPESRSNDVQIIAGEKVKWAFEHLHAPVVALDAGFYIHSLNGFPRAFVNFALETIDLDGLLTLVNGKPRHCEFRECLAYIDESRPEPNYFLSLVPGRLAEQQRGAMQPHLWSRLGLIFIPDGSTKTLAEMQPEEYLQWRTQYREKSSGAKAFARWFANQNTSKVK
ncbi:MAG TPA: non-canonical purine NTP pyrophosphatase [Candidatus Nanoarchaeia archaeon]|nr:non-canonical purine NTP pyrophosphatase [Candidatus Nanoarchaeia archaeon]